MINIAWCYWHFGITFDAKTLHLHKGDDIDTLAHCHAMLFVTLLNAFFFPRSYWHNEYDLEIFSVSYFGLAFGGHDFQFQVVASVAVTLFDDCPENKNVSHWAVGLTIKPMRFLNSSENFNESHFGSYGARNRMDTSLDGSIQYKWATVNNCCVKINRANMKMILL